MVYGSATAVVCRLRVRGRVDDAAARRAQRALAAADVRPPSLPAHAILCIRRLGDPKPRRVKTDAGSIRPPRDWEDAARTAVAQAAADAARPARGPVGAAAGAILFADRAELLACLARDWCDGLFHASWWWRALLGSRDAAEAVLYAFRATPEAVPAALHTLARERRLETFLGKLAPPEAWAIANDVARAFGVDVEALADIVRATPGNAPATAPLAPLGRLGDDGPVDDVVNVRHAAERAREAATIVPEIAALRAELPARALAIVSLIVHRAPSMASRILRMPPRREAPALAHTRASGAAAAAPPVAATVAIDRDRTQLAIETAAWPSPGPEDANTEPRSMRVEATALSVAVTDPGSGSVETGEATSPLPEAVETAFGGAFYLINVATALGLYADFTAPRGRNLPYPLWDFLVVSAQSLAGKPLARDPLAPLLARLAGRLGGTRPPARVVRAVRRRVPRLRAAIAERLGIHESVAGPRLIVAPARVFLAPATIEVRFPLADLPIEIRLAGLDRDPGFIPAAARTIVFTYA